MISCRHRDKDASEETGTLTDVKLVSGSSECDGRVQIRYNKQWGAVCHSGWDLADATVLCRELDCGDIAEPKAYVGTSGQIWVDQLACTGNELTVQDCPFTGWGVSSCLDGLHAGVFCQKTLRKVVVRILVKAKTGVNFNDAQIKNNLLEKIRNVVGSKVNWITQPDEQVFHKRRTATDVKLVSGSSECDGRVQIRYNKQWGAVCHSGWDLADATVLCRELNCGDIVEPKEYVETSELILMDELACTGNELTVQDCPFTGWGVSSCLDGLHAGVFCQKTVRKVVVRIAVKAKIGVNVNDPDIKNKLLDKIRSVVESKGEYSVNWRTQPDEQVFHQQRTATDFSLFEFTSTGDFCILRMCTEAVYRRRETALLQSK
ncbi:hypothetical protein G5714_005067 [Onychostoma macrolepis]|uniref:SRCR domain-containing protein n=1 Tax=Onychostoma macrolepis TaxID=369639 RepID=A0A7J6D765_9TELE|nr:hypothetical protein G5714_005067 [Onychostoma macrolepis]